jgi:hypothetical protein
MPKQKVWHGLRNVIYSAERVSEEQQGWKNRCWDDQSRMENFGSGEQRPGFTVLPVDAT